VIRLYSSAGRFAAMGTTKLKRNKPYPAVGACTPRGFNYTPGTVGLCAQLLGAILTKSAMRLR